VAGLGTVGLMPISMPQVAKQVFLVRHIVYIVEEGLPLQELCLMFKLEVIMLPKLTLL
jgi:hypothetical protein